MVIAQTTPVATPPSPAGFRAYVRVSGELDGVTSVTPSVCALAGTLSCDSYHKAL